MRVAYFVERFWPYIGGVEVVSATLLTELAARGHEVTVIADSAAGALPARESYGGVEVHRFDIVRPYLHGIVRDARRTREAIASLRRDLRPDVVHAVFLGSTTFYAAASRDAFPAPLLLAFHGTWPDFWATPGRSAATRSLIRCADWVSACSQSTLDVLLRDGLGRAGSSSVIPSVSPLADTQPTPLPTGSPLLVCLARLSPEKGLDLALEAFPAVRTRHPDARLMIGGDGPERARLQEQAHALGIADAVEFTGWIAPPAVPQLLARASVVLIPSRAEGFGLTALEAAWAGRPIVACAVGGLAEQLSHGETALLVPPQNPAALAAAAIELLSDRRRALAIAAGARRAAGRAATVDECADRHEYLYGELIARWATPRRRRGEAV